MFDEVQKAMRSAAGELLASGKVATVIGYESATLPFRSRPSFIQDAADAEKLVWNQYCRNNLAVYLPRFFKKSRQPQRMKEPLPNIGIVVKGCDARSIKGLLAEHQVPRENIVVIGVPCPGMAASGGPDEAATESDPLPDGCLEAACRSCASPRVNDADIVIKGSSRSPARPDFSKVGSFEELSRDERWNRLSEEFANCIRCYACRQACPNCYCETCFVDQTKPRWIAAGDELSDILIFHLTRVYHQAGRCVSCDACSRACPVGIDLAILNRKIAKDVEEMFSFVPGLSEASYPMSDYDDKDSESFIFEP